MATRIPSVTFTGNEVAFVLAALAQALPSAGRDFDIIDNLVDRAIAGLGGRLDHDVAAYIEALRAEGCRTSG